jgi:hypothetical protein
MMCMKTVNSKLSLLFIMAASLGFFGLVSCSKKSSGGGGPKDTTVVLLGGYASSDSVATSSLLAYWPMNGNVNDVKGGIAGTGVNVSYVTGIRGQAYQGDTNAYASFTPSAAMTGLQSFSLSVWYWQAAQPVDSPSNTPQGLFFLADANGADPLIILENEHYAPLSGDSLRFHAGLTFTAATAYKGFTMETFDTAAIGKWVHLVMTYNGGTSTYVIYQNAQPMTNQSAYGFLTSTVLLDGPTGSTPQGNINWAATPAVEGTIGTWAPGVYGVSSTLGSNGNWTGKIDELRLFNKALTQTEVSGLFLNGKVGR